VTVRTPFLLALCVASIVLIVACTVRLSAALAAVPFPTT
jgi:hypothetical protein